MVSEQVYVKALTHVNERKEEETSRQAGLGRAGEASLVPQDPEGEDQL